MWMFYTVVFFVSGDVWFSTGTSWRRQRSSFIHRRGWHHRFSAVSSSEHRPSEDCSGPSSLERFRSPGHFLLDSWVLLGCHRFLQCAAGRCLPLRTAGGPDSQSHRRGSPQSCSRWGRLQEDDLPRPSRSSSPEPAWCHLQSPPLSLHLQKDSAPRRDSVLCPGPWPLRSPGQTDRRSLWWSSCPRAECCGEVFQEIWNLTFG